MVDAELARAPCLYCRRVDVPRTKEHVLQDAFAAVAILPTEVCAECNNGFSAIDKSFVDAVHFHYTGQNMLRQLGNGRAVLENGVAVAARYRANGNGEFPPQLYEATPTTWKFLGHREADFHAMLRELRAPEALQVKSAVLTGDGIPRLAILRSSPNVYLVQGVEAVTVEQFAQRIRSEGFKPDWFNESFSHGRTENPAITFDTSLKLEPFCRAMAKVALNFVCYRLGIDTALRPAFDAVRRYARYGEGHFMDFAVPTLLNHDLSDSLQAFVTEHHHACFLVKGGADEGPREALLLAIRGKTIGRLDLTRGNPGLTQGTWLLSRFDEDQRSVEDLTLPKDMLRALLNPAALGLEHLWPPK